ncbi:phosphotransferase [Kribbella sp. NPDC004536]|uniref:phosphotransferase n=1 Tax=Kribbella sp. NPDC004536 TaxID=3364106 RepID=UPI0036B8F5C7
MDLAVSGRIEILGVGPWSTVLRIETDKQPVFFKATGVREVVGTLALGRRLPQNMPELIGADVERGWLLMVDAGERLRERIRPTKDATLWSGIMSHYSRIQRDVADHVGALLEMGVPDRRLARLPALLTELMDDAAFWRCGESRRLTPDDRGHIEAALVTLSRTCDELAAIGIPESIDHGDLHDGNVLLGAGQVKFIDWGDIAVTHPFVSLRTLFVSIEISLGLPEYSFSPAMMALLQEYLGSWAEVASPRALERAFELAQCVAPVVRALSWHEAACALEGAVRRKYVNTVRELLLEFVLYTSKVRQD